MQDANALRRARRYPDVRGRLGAAGLALLSLSLCLLGQAHGQPLDGTWTGSTSQGSTYGFTVQGTGTSISSLTFGWSCSGPGGSTTGTRTIQGNIPISGNQFTLSGTTCPNYSTGGTFSSPTAASGTLNLSWTYVPGVCLCSGSANLTWSATRQLPQADLYIAKTDGSTTAIPGQPVAYTITVANAGPTSVSGATVADAVPTALSGASWTCTASAGSSCTAGPIAGNINDTVNIAVGGTLTYVLNGTLSPSASGTLSNTASVTAPGTVSDPNTSNNTATDTDTLTPRTDLATSQSAAPNPASATSYITYTVWVANNGPSQASGVTLSDTLPTGLAFVSASPGAPTCQHAAGIVTCALGTLAPGALTSVSLVASIRAGTVGLVSNTVSVAGAETDPVSANNSSTLSTTVSAFTKGDINSDTQTDLIFRNLTNGRNLTWFMQGNTRTAEAYIVPDPVDLNWQIAGSDDFNADLKNDLVFWNIATGQVEFWLMNGVTRTGAPVPISGAPALDLNWKLSSTADFNHDGKPDILWRNTLTQKIAIWTMNGTTVTGTIVPSPDQAVDPNWVVVGTLDWNGDSNTDFLWYNYSSGKIVLWFMDANVVRITGQFTNPANAGDNNWNVLAVGDYGVGPGGLPYTKDIVWRNATSGRLVVWWMDQAGNRTWGTFTSPDSPPSPLDWTIVGPR